MADVIINNLSADSIKTDELNTGNMIVSGAARFVQPIYADIKGSKDINQATTASSYTNSDYILITDGSSLRKISVTTFINQIVAAVAEIVDTNNDSAENTGY